jgi:hypothetical protein
MNKICLPYDTWGYEEFISVEEQKELINWVYSNFHRLQANGKYRFWYSFRDSDDSPNILNIIKKRLIDVEKIDPYIQDPFFGDFLGVVTQDGAIHKHKDPNQPNCTHTRYNLLLKIPKEGGNPVYEDEIIPYKERFIWRCEAGIHYHASLPVLSDDNPRINISFGFSIPDKL